MEPTLKNGDTLLVMSAGYSAETGDIVVIDDKRPILSAKMTVLLKRTDWAVK